LAQGALGDAGGVAYGLARNGKARIGNNKAPSPVRACNAGGQIRAFVDVLLLQTNVRASEGTPTPRSATWSIRAGAI
jgi:hypothetical protein